MSTPYILLLIERYIEKNISEDELIALNELLKNDENAKYFKNFVKDEYLLKTKNVNFNAEESFVKIKPRIVDKKVFFFKPLYKYTAAASILIIAALAYLLNVKNDEPQFTEPVIVNQSIKPGRGKATLTLEDGSVLELEKGTSIQTQNVNSNGEQIIYKSGERSSSEIAYNYLTIPRGGQFHLILSDGTEVWLNSESQLKYPVSFIKGEVRTVELIYGEAYFDVSPSSEHKGAEFKVINQFQEVEVLGTEFNVKAYKDESKVYTTLVEGKVAIDNGVTKQILIPNQQSKLDTENNSVTIVKVDVEGEVSWRKGVFSFERKTLKDIMKVLSRWYDVDIVFENEDLKSVNFNGILDKYQSLEEILLIMKSSSINNYEIKNKIITLK
ncbi:FecR family protein, partial [Flavivirga spongiicola]